MTLSPAILLLSASLQCHAATSSFVVDPSTGPTSTASLATPLTPYQKMLIAHGILCTLGVLFFLPLGALLARYYRTFSPNWLLGHWVAQFILAGPTIVTGIVIAIVAGSPKPHFHDYHERLGVVFLIFYLLQCVLGASIHWNKPKGRDTDEGRPPQNYAHAAAGIILIGLGFYQVRTGFYHDWPVKSGLGELPKGVNILWWIWVVLLPVLYATGLLFLPKQYAQERLGRKNAKPRPNDCEVDVVTVPRDRHCSPGIQYGYIDSIDDCAFRGSR